MNGHLPADHTAPIDVAPARAGKRIAAYLINVILTLLAYAPLLIAIVVWPSNSYIERTQGLEALAASDWLMPGLLIGFLVLLAYIIIQVRMMSKHGQSIGKKIMHIRLLKTDGTNPGFWGAVMLREVVYNIMLTIAAMIIGYAVVLLSGAPAATADVIANVLTLSASLACFVMLFNKQKSRRTLQDYLAGTVVVQLR